MYSILTGMIYVLDGAETSRKGGGGEGFTSGWAVGQELGGKVEAGRDGAGAGELGHRESAS